jgi:hypothetical protein
LHAIQGKDAGPLLSPEAMMKKLRLDVDAVRVESFRTGSPVPNNPLPRVDAATPVCSGTTCILQCLTVQPRCF